MKSAQIYKYSQEFFAIRNEDVHQICTDFEPNAIDPDYVYWLNFHSLNDRDSLELLCQKLQLDKLSIESIFLPLRRSKVEEYPNYLFFQIHTLKNNSSSASDSEKLSFIVGKSFLLSFQEHQGQHFSEVRQRIEKSKGKIRSQKSDFLLFRLLDALIDEIFVKTEEVSDQIDIIDAGIHSAMKGELLRDIEMQKRELIELRKLIQPIKDLLAGLETMEHPLIDPSNTHYFKNLRNSCTSLLEDVEAHKQILDSLSNLYYAAQGQRMNEIMKVLTVVSSIFIPLTFIVGVYGMNFKYMPELEYPYGYYTVVGVMICIGVGLFAYFMKRGWLKRD
ncbi:MAG: magnesium and cobalt transport protein CorA [Bacteroidota bacterium]